MIKYNKDIKLKDKDGYQYFLDKDHPLSCGNSGLVYYHRHIGSIKIGRWLKSKEHVHHTDGNKSNNDKSNLAVMTSREHHRIHRGEKQKKNCLVCGRVFAADRRDKSKFCSQECCRFYRRKVEWPSEKQLKNDIENMSWVGIGKKYGVSDNAVRKWARKYKLL